MRIAALLLVVVGSTAHAESISDDAWYPRVSAGAGIGYRAGDLARLTPQGVDVMLQAEVKVRPSTFIDASFDFAPGTASDDFLTHDVKITTNAAQLAVRNALFSFGEKPSSLGGDMFVTAGIAREWIEWDGGGMTRNMVMLGAGTTLVLPHDDFDRHLRFGFRLFFGRAPDPGKVAEGCDGPCDTPTKTEPYDFSLVMEVSCHIGH